MGRYVSGDFEYKFAFAEQGSSLGFVLESIEDDLKGEAISTERFINENGEICRMYVYDFDAFEKHVKEVYLEDFKEKTDKEWDKWCACKEKFGQEWHDQNMMKLLIANLNKNQENFEFEIEY